MASKDGEQVDWTEDSMRRFYLVAGSRVRRARKAYGWNQDDLASAVGLTRSSIANIEAGRQRAPIHIVVLIAQSLQSSLEDLIPALSEVEELRTLRDSNLDLDGQAESTQDFVTATVRRALGSQ